MKKILLSLSMFAMMGAASAQNSNVSVSNLSSNSYYGGYNNSTKMITGINFEVLADLKTSSDDVLDDFEVSLYLWDGNNPIIIKTYTISGMHQASAMDYTNESVDLSKVNNLSDGQYRLGVWANSNIGIPQPPDDGSDNAFLIKVDNDINKSYINFTAAGGSGNGIEVTQKTGILMPNPLSADQLSQIIQNNSLSSVKVYDMIGKQQDISSLSEGVYFVNYIKNNEQYSVKLNIQ
jgi:hypothetical protein